MKKHKDFIFEGSYTKIGNGAQRDVPPHLHYHAELVIAISGGFEVIVDGSLYSVEEGCAVIVFPYQMHEYLERDSKSTSIMLLSPRCDSRFVDYFDEYVPISPLIDREYIDTEILTCSTHMHEHNRHNTPLKSKLIESYMETIFAILLERIPLKRIDAMINIDTLDRIMQWIYTHFTEQITVTDAARELRLSESHISHLLAARLHIGFREYLNLLRVQTAIERLTSTAEPIGDIALDSGFGSFASFNRIFKETTGLTPREYRQKGMFTNEKLNSMLHKRFK